jgi:hypothetical protein
MWHRVDVVLTDVSEERITSIFRVEGKIRKSASEETVRTGASRLITLLAPVYLSRGHLKVKTITQWTQTGKCDIQCIHTYTRCK